MFDIADPMMLATANEERPWAREETTTTSYNPCNSQRRNKSNVEPLETYFFPFCAGCKKCNYRVRDSGLPRDDGRMIDKLIGAKLEKE